MSLCLASILYDPEGKLYPQLEAQAAKLFETFDSVAVYTSPLTFEKSKTLLQASGARLKDRKVKVGGIHSLGRFRRKSLELALETEPDFVFYCDFDAVLHWLETHPQELEQCLNDLQTYDFTVFGRTARAFESFLASLTETENIVNNLFERVTGHRWDILAASRGMSARAAAHIVKTCEDDAISNDATWPLLALQQDWQLNYQEVAGIEYSGPGAADQLKDEINSWLVRMDMARLHIEAIQKFA